MKSSNQLGSGILLTEYPAWTWFLAVPKRQNVLYRSIVQRDALSQAFGDVKLFYEQQHRPQNGDHGFGLGD